MATPSGISTVQFDTKCPVCQSVFKDPKILPCAHVLCRKCLISLLSKVDNEFSSFAKCPLCRDGIVNTTNISSVENVVDEMPNDLCLKAYLKCTQILEKEHTCIVHESETATAVCLQCHDWLCSECVKPHNKLSITRSHRVENVETLTTELLAANLPTKCPVHEEEYKLYCCNHESVVCSLCDAKHDVPTPHRASCSVVHLEDIEKEARDSLRKMLDKIREMEAVLEQAIGRLNQDLQKVHNSAKATLREIDDVCASLVKSVETFGESLKHILEENTKATKVKLENSKVTFERKRGKLKTHEQLVERSAIATPSSDVWGMKTLFEKRLHDLDSFDPSHLHSNEPLELLQLDVKKMYEAKRALDAQLTLCEIAFKKHSAPSQASSVSHIEDDGAEKPSFDAKKTFMTHPSVTCDTISTSTGCETGYKAGNNVSAARDADSYRADEIVAAADGDGYNPLHGTRRNESEENDGVPPALSPSPWINLETDFTPYIYEDYELTTDFKRGRPVFSSTIKRLKSSRRTEVDAEGPLKNQLVKRFEITSKAERQKHLHTVVENFARQMRKGRQSAGDEMVYIWRSDTLSVDLNLPMGNHPPACVTDQLFLLGTHLPPIVLVIYDTHSVSSNSETSPQQPLDNIAEEVQDFTVKVARLLTTSLLNFCCCDFVLLPCTVDVAGGSLSADVLETEILEQMEFVGTFYSKKQELDATAVCEMRKAVTALTSATRVPLFLHGILEDELLLMEPEWSAALCLAIDAFVNVTEGGVITYTTETEMKIKFLVLEAARRLSFRQEVAVLTEDNRVKICIQRLIEQAKEEHDRILLLRRMASTTTTCVIYIDLSHSEPGGLCAGKPRVFSVQAEAPGSVRYFPNSL